MSPHNFAHRTNWEFKENQVTTLLQEFDRSNTAYLNLTESNPTRCGFAYPKEKILQALQREENFLYKPEAKGLHHARETVVDYFASQDISLSADDIFLTASTSEAYGFLFRLLVNPGENVLFAQPSYPLFSFLGDIHDVELRFYQLHESEGWHIDFESLKSKIDEKTKAICLVNPNNPTGSYITEEELEVLKEICEEHGLTLICDEVFWEFVLDKQKHPTLLQYEQTPTCVLGGLSKTLGLPQMKLGWLILRGPQTWKNQAQQRLEIIADTYLSVNTPTQNALAAWLSLQKELFGPLYERVQSNWAFLVDEVSTIKSTQLLSSQGGWYVVLSVPSVRSEEEWVLKLLSKYHVLVHPGYFYDFWEGTHLVISLLPESNIFHEGVQRLLSRIEQQCV